MVVPPTLKVVAHPLGCKRRNGRPFYAKNVPKLANLAKFKGFRRFYELFPELTLKGFTFGVKNVACQATKNRSGLSILGSMCSCLGTILFVLFFFGVHVLRHFPAGQEPYPIAKKPQRNRRGLSHMERNDETRISYSTYFLMSLIIRSESFSTSWSPTEASIWSFPIPLSLVMNT